jgi:CRP/FNR family transcriptional regulator, cyclic AMP receptor protein
MPDELQPILSVVMNNIARIENQPVIKRKFRPFLLRETKCPDASFKRTPFLSHVSQDAFLALMGKAKTVTYPKKATIVTEGDGTNSLFIILSGKVRVYSIDNKGREVTLNIQECGTYFGEIALLTDEPRSVSIMSLENTVCAVISKRDFINWLMAYPDAVFAFLGELSNKIKQLTDKVKLMALSNVYERTAKTLQDLAVPRGDFSVIHDRPSQQDLACMVGASREMINKIMIELTKGGYVLSQESTLILCKNLPSSW